ncbi:hypothetical protein [Streptomyces sp. NPDC059459]|uniref:hypothetical protein n=1 Tax=unclassified Streptomyces TaxID=2593676 RepID=UPI0036C87309
MRKPYELRYRLVAGRIRAGAKGVGMSGAIISVVIAIVGVGGTLTSSVVTQVLSHRAELRRLEGEKAARLAELRTAADERRIDELRRCYVQLNARDRHYRDVMLAYAYALRTGAAEAEAAEVGNARREQRDTRAEAQLVASDAVLELESRVNDRLTTAYRYLMKAAGEPDSPARRTRLREIIDLLDSIIPQQGNIRALMRLEVGTTQGLPDWYDPEGGLAAHHS